jgi:hypothetical protein
VWVTRQDSVGHSGGSGNRTLVLQPVVGYFRSFSLETKIKSCFYGGFPVPCCVFSRTQSDPVRAVSWPCSLTATGTFTSEYGNSRLNVCSSYHGGCRIGVNHANTAPSPSLVIPPWPTPIIYREGTGRPVT